MLNAYELIGFMPADLSADLLNWAYDADKSSYKATLAAVAQARHVRPLFLEKQPRAQRHATMIATLARPSLDAAAGTVLRSWLLGRHSAVITEFLDALGITHKNGVVDGLPATVDDDKLKQAVDAILGHHRREVVIVYLNAFNGLNGANWPTLGGLLDSDSRLQL
jgi:hypothetical protein